MKKYFYQSPQETQYQKDSSLSVKKDIREEDKKFKFTRDWFSQHIPKWKKTLQGIENEKINVLEIGVFEGRSTIWILEELFENPESKLIAIDNFKEYIAGDDNETIFRENIRKSGKENQVEIIKNNSFDALAKLNHEKRIKFNFIYIDASHFSCDVLSDAVLAWNLLKEGGIMIFDDYEWDRFEEEHNNPRIAIDSFLRCYQQQIEVIYKHYQVAIKKFIHEDSRTVREDKDFIEEFIV